MQIRVQIILHLTYTPVLMYSTVMSNLREPRSVVPTLTSTFAEYNNFGATANGFCEPTKHDVRVIHHPPWEDCIDGRMFCVGGQQTASALLIDNEGKGLD
jgi:hypothetical protein